MTASHISHEATLGSVKNAGRVHVQVNQEEPKLRTHAGRNYADLQRQLLSSRATAEVTFNIEWWIPSIQRNIVHHAFLAMIKSDTKC